MKIKLGESIRRLRKESGFTQEQLAEALGVSVSAVHKWESGKAAPELEMLVDIAEFFETSVDAMLNYDCKKLNIQQITERIRAFSREKNLSEGSRFAEKMLQKYPNDYHVVLSSAELYYMTLKSRYMPRAIELFEKAIQLSGQLENREITVMQIQNSIAYCYLVMEKTEEAVRILKKNNVQNMNSHNIGMVLSRYADTAEESLEYLASTLNDAYNRLINTCVGFANAYRFHRVSQMDDVAELIIAVQKFGEKLRNPQVVNWIDRGDVMLYCILAAMDRMQGRIEDARQWLVKAKKSALKFDASPNYHTSSGLKFTYGIENCMSYDSMGGTALEIIDKFIAEEENAAKLRPLWEEIRAEE